MYGFLGARLGDLRFESIRGESGIGHTRLVFRLEFLPFQRDDEDRYTLHSFEADVAASGDGGQEQRLGRAVQSPPGVILLWTKINGPHSLDLALDLDRHKIEGLETLRSGRGLTFVLNVSALVVNAQGTSRPLVRVTTAVNQGSWIEVLSQMEYAKYHLLELPAFPSDACPHLTVAFDHLADARAELLHGEWRDAVGKTRDVMEALAAALDDGDAMRNAGPLFENVRGMDRTARIQMLRRALMLFASPARHADTVSSGFDWQRSDAIMAVHIAAALLGRATRGTQESG